MKLLFDENLSPRLVDLLSSLFPESTHVRNVGLAKADDESVWSHAKKHGFVIVSKDSDFHQRSFVLGVHLRLFGFDWAIVQPKISPIFLLITRQISNHSRTIQTVHFLS